ncbi:MAG: glycosyltransferase family 39 protein [Patescibacteria group bacterium]
MKIKDFITILLILLIALLLRLYKIDIPLADFHSWRQADTAAVSRNFVNREFNLLKPQYDDLSSIQSGMENPEGLRFVEFPIYNAVVATFYKYLPLLTLEVYGRLVTAFFSLILIFIIYYFLRLEVGYIAAIIGSSIYAIFPFFVFFSRVILPETTALSLAFISIFFTYLYNKSNKKSASIVYFLLSSFFFSLALLVKPTVGFFLLTIFYLFFKKHGSALFKKASFYFYLMIIFAPFAAWRAYIVQFPQGVPAFNWLIDRVNTSEGQVSIFFRPAFFRWIFFERINNIILGGYLTFFFILGIFYKQKKFFLYSILISSVLYLLTFQGGNVQHEYYQVLILPALAIFTALGVTYIIKYNRQFLSPLFSLIIGIFIFAFSYLISYNYVKSYYNYSTDLVNISKIINNITTPEDLIITDTVGDTTLLYLSERRGSPAPYSDLPTLKEKGYTYFATLNGEVAEQVEFQTSYEIVFQNEKFTLFKL